MDPLTILLLAAITAYSVFTIVFFAYLTWSILVEWFQSHEEVATQLNNVAATVKTALESGELAIVQGIFNKKTGDPVKGRIIKYDELDSRVREAHRNSDVVIWQ
jgi:hypothetical protein